MRILFLKWYGNVLAVFNISLIIYFVTRDSFLSFAADNPYPAGFIKFFILASIGDFVSVKIRTGLWSTPKNIVLKAIVWGYIGMAIVFMFKLYPSIIYSLQEHNILPFEGVLFFEALFISTLMNLTFAPVMMTFHKVTDTVLDNMGMKYKDVFKLIDWKNFRHLILFKTIPLFWIPMHTITFLLPNEYRVIFAAILGIFLGLLLGLSKKINK